MQDEASGRVGGLASAARPITPPDALLYDGAHAAAPRLFVIAGDRDVHDALGAAASAQGLRLLGAARADQAEAALGEIATLELIWMEVLAADLAAPAACFDALAGRLRTLVDLGSAHLVICTDRPSLDAVHAAFGAHATILCAPSAAERALALSLAWDSPGSHVHDVVREPDSNELARLYEEVARISRMLSQLTHGDASRLSGGAAPPVAYGAGGHAASPSPFIEDHVAAPARGYRGPPPLDGMPPARPPGYAPGPRAALVRRLIRLRRMREHFFAADMFADPAWDMLLDLYAARLERAQVSVSSLCIAAAVPATTALRWVKSMTDAGIFVRMADPHDGRRVFIALSEASAEALDRYFALAEAEGFATI